jgi:threonine synthase
MTKQLKHTVLKCINPECREEFNPHEIRYSCNKCGNLLEVSHNLDLLKIHRGKDWRDIFDKRLGSQKFPYGSGVWRFFELILPDIPVEKIISIYEGDTNLAYSSKLNHLYDAEDLHIKLEGENPTLSFKDRGMTAGVSWANYLGVKAVACASTGDTSAAMAAYAANSENLKGIVLMPENKVSFEQLSQPISSGSLTLALQTDFDGCMNLVQKLCGSNEIYLLNSMNSFRIEGQKAILFEIIQQLRWEVPDWIVVPVGNAGNISALGKALKEFYYLGIIEKVPRLAGIQIQNANPLFSSYKNNWADLEPMIARDTFASAIRIGAPVSFKKAVDVLKWTEGIVEEVSEQELMDAMVEVDKAGISICPNSGTAVAGYKKLREKNIIMKKDKVVIVSTAHGLKFSQLKIDYHQKKFKHINCDKANTPISLPATLEAVQNLINS